VPRPDGLLAAFDARLPFRLTAGQQEVCDAMLADIALRHPMQRLLQGEVGSGKTVCAVRAMLTVVDAEGQAALLAPTEVLAQQHHRTIVELLGPLAERGMLALGGDSGADAVATKVVLLTGSMSTAARRQALADVVSGEAGIVVGTHALLEERVEFYQLL
jgi:ATP-dependent DNA helicase RecG